ncbi:MAG TPA: GntR family transcriptional regulator [Rugosimonospora sp.]
MIFTDDDRPIWKQIADELRDRVLSGVLTRGHPLPPESELMREFGCSRTTVRKAVALLRAEGWVAVETLPEGGVRHFVCAVETVTLRPGDVFASVAPIGVTRANGSFDIYPAGTAITCT